MTAQAGLLLLGAGVRTRARMKGTSMLPLLHAPMVLEIAPLDRVRIGDVIVREERGTLVAHRLVALATNGDLVLAGDAQPLIVERAHRDEVVGRVARVLADDMPDAPALFFPTWSIVCALVGRTHKLRAAGDLVYRALHNAFPFTRRRDAARLFAAVAACVRAQAPALRTELHRHSHAVVREARRRRLLPFLASSAARLGCLEEIPESPESLVALRAVSASQARRIERKTTQVLDSLLKAGVAAIPLKGAARALDGGSAADHPSTDVDVLISSRDVRRAVSALQPLHRFLAEPAHYDRHHHLAPMAAADGVPVELHTALAPPASTPRITDWVTLSSGFRTRNGTLRLDNVDTFLHLLLHQLDRFELRDTTIAAQMLAADPGLLHAADVRLRSGEDRFRLHALATIAARLAGASTNATRLERAYCRWIVAREDVPSVLRYRSQAVDAAFACAAADMRAARCALFSGISRIGETRRGLALAARICGRVACSLAALLYAMVMPSSRSSSWNVASTRKASP